MMVKMFASIISFTQKWLTVWCLSPITSNLISLPGCQCIIINVETTTLSSCLDNVLSTQRTNDVTTVAFDVTISFTTIIRSKAIFNGN